MTEIIVEAPTYTNLRITVPAIEALEKAGNRVKLCKEHKPVALYNVTLTHPINSIKLVRFNDYMGNQYTGLRLATEPEYPNELYYGVSWHERGDWVPCPTCGASLVWYEAGYVPGYRICLNKHRVQLSSNGLTAKALDN